MSTSLDEELTTELLHACAHADDDSSRKTAASMLALHVWESGVAESWALNFRRTYSAAVDLEEMRQIVVEGVMARALAITPAEYGKLVKATAHLFFAAKRAVEAFCDSGAVTLAGHMTGVNRRHRRAQKAVQDYIAEFGATPTAAELVEWANTKTYANVADPVKSGLLITAEDVEGTLVRGHSLDNEEFTLGAQLAHEDQVDERASLALTATQIVELVAELYEDPALAREVARALDAWIDLVAAGETPTITALARELDCSRARAAEHDAAIQGVLAAYRQRHDP